MALDLKTWLKKYKWWLVIGASFIITRLAVFFSFWQASANKGGWANFYNQVEQTPSILNMLFHEYCDWHPPLYYALSSAVLFLFHSPWFIYLANMILAALVLFLSYRIARLFFSRAISLSAVFLLAIEPYWAWTNWLFFSENLSIPLFLFACYQFLRYIKEGKTKFFYWSAAGLALATLTRPNNLLLAPLLIALMLLIFWIKTRLRLEVLPGVIWQKAIVSSAVFLLIFAALLAPWVIRNKFVYDRFGLANILYTNIYFYNLPPLMSLKEHIPYGEALERLIDQAGRDLGKNVGDKSDCRIFTNQQLNNQFDYYQSEAKKYILANLPLYLKIHLIKTVPFFFQPGYLDMYSAYTGSMPKIDITGSILSGDMGAIWSYLTRINSALLIYLAGLAFWTLASLSLFFSLIYSFFADRKKFIFFLIFSVIIIYNALLISPFVMARYRLPLYVVFFLALAYAVGVAYDYLRRFNSMAGRSRLKKTLKFLPVVSWIAKYIYDFRRQQALDRRVSDFLALPELPHRLEAPPCYEIGYEPTIRCNLRCKMCYQGENRGLRQSELSKEDIIRVFEKLAPKAKEIKLVGGEPFAREDILGLIAFWDSRGKRVILQTNCTMINENNIEQLSQYKNLTDILTSLDGPREVHDAIRGVPGTFDRLEKAVGLIRKKMPEVPITVFATLLINDNLDDFFALIDTTKKLGITTINVLFEQVYSPADVEKTREIFGREFGWREGQDYRLNTQTREPVFPEHIDSYKLKKKLDAIRFYGMRKGCFVNYSPFNFYNNLSAYLGQNQMRPFCLKLLQPELRINQRGEVVWCDIIEKSFGSLLERNPDEIWLSPDYQKFREYLRNKSLPICSRCCKAIYI